MNFVTAYVGVHVCLQSMCYAVTTCLLCCRIAANDDRTSSIVTITRQAINQNVQMVVFIFPNNRGERYAAVKKICCMDLPVPSQVVLRKNLQDKKIMSVVTKVAIQMNCKMGGDAWRITVPGNMMICGYDTYHDSAQKNRSVCAFVTTYNQACSRYYSQTAFVQRKGELSDHLQSFMMSENSVLHSFQSMIRPRFFFILIQS